MNKILKTLRKTLRYDQKKHWDRISYSYLKTHDPIIDVGCGEGRFISQDVHTIIGIDWNPESVKHCKLKGFKVIQGDIRVLPFEDGSICGIHCSHVIEHFLPSDVHKILTEFDRVLCDKGILIIRSPLLWSEFYSDLTHVRPYTPTAIIQYLTHSTQTTLRHISGDYEIVRLKWRYKPLRVGVRYFDGILNSLNRWGFPWLTKNGYMLVMKKNDKND